MTLIIEYVNSTVFKEIHKIHPTAIIQIDYTFPEFAYMDVILVPGKLCFQAKLDICEKPELQKEIEALSIVTEQKVKE
jgi:hypothetical protein